VALARLVLPARSGPGPAPCAALPARCRCAPGRRPHMPTPCPRDLHNLPKATAGTTLVHRLLFARGFRPKTPSQRRLLWGWPAYGIVQSRTVLTPLIGCLTQPQGWGHAQAAAAEPPRGPMAIGVETTPPPWLRPQHRRQPLQLLIPPTQPFSTCIAVRTTKGGVGGPRRAARPWPGGSTTAAARRDRAIASPPTSRAPGQRLSRRWRRWRRPRARRRRSAALRPFGLKPQPRHGGARQGNHPALRGPDCWSRLPRTLGEPARFGAIATAGTDRTGNASSTMATPEDEARADGSFP